MSYRREREETIAQLTREGWSLDAIRKLLRAAKTAQRLAIEGCNGPRDEKRHERASYLSDRRIAAICETEDSPCLGVQTEGDPRGYVVKVRLKSGRSNHWGGETWGVPA